MPNATITSTASTFGTISGTFAADQSTVAGTIAGIITGTLTGSVGVPGPTGSQGPQGPQGEPGQGVPSGGSTGQFLTKASGTSYDTSWTTLSLAGYATESWVTAGFLAKAGGYMTGDIISLNGIGFYMANQAIGASTYCNYTWSGIWLSSQTSALVIQPDGITFPGGGTSKQTVAYPGMAAFEALFYPLYSNPAGYLTDAPSNGYFYGRRNGDWDIISVSGSYLPLAGGALDANASITASDTGTTTDSELAGWGLGVQLTADHAQGTTVEYNGLNVYDSAGQMQVTPTGLTFPDSTVQSTAWLGGDYRTLTDFDFSNVTDTKLTSYGMTLLPPVAEIIPYNSYVSSDAIQFSSDFTYALSQPGNVYSTIIDQTSVRSLTTIWDYDGNGDLVSDGGLGFTVNNTGYFFTTGSGYDLNAIRLYRNQLYFPSGTNLTGFPSTPTPSTSDNSTRLATTAFVKNQAYAPLASPALTGTPTAPTASTGTSSTQIATTAFVQSAIIAGSAHAETLQATVRNNTGATLSPFTVVYINGALGNNATVAKAQANSEATSSGTFAVTQAAINNNADGIVISAGVLSNVDTSAYTDGDKLYLSPTTAGAVTTTKPSAPNHLVYVGVVTRSHPTLGTVSVRIANGFELEELHNVAISSVTNLDLLSYESSTSLWKNKSFSTLGLLTSSTAASTYAPLASPTFTGTVTIPAGASISGFAPLASPALTGTPTSTTAAASTNTTQIATTAFVVGQAGTATPVVNGTAAVGTSLLYSRQDHVHPTDTTRAPAVATVANSFAQNNTAPVTALTSLLASVTPAVLSPMAVSMSAGQSGTGATTAPGGSSITPMSISLQAPNAATTGYAAKGIIIGAPSLTNAGSIDWSKPMAFSCRLGSSTLGAAKTDVKVRGVLGRDGNTFQVPGTLAVKGFGWEFNHATGVLSAIAHNGSSLTTTAVTFTPVNFRAYDIVCYYDGAGTVSIYVNGTLAGTATGGPTGIAGVTNIWVQWEIENTTTSAPANTNVGMGNPKVMTTF